MSKTEKRINKIFNILYQFEQIDVEDSDITKESWLNYLDRLYVWYLGYGNEEIYVAIKGLKESGGNIDHDTVKRVVFEIIKILQKGG